MVKARLETGTVIDGFRIDELMHAGGMAHLWSVTRLEDGATFLMKTPVVYEGEDPAAIVSFEMEQMIMPRLKGPHVPRHVANGDFAVQPYIVMERIAGRDAAAAAQVAAAAARTKWPNSAQASPMRCSPCMSRTSCISTSSRPTSCSGRRAKRC